MDDRLLIAGTHSGCGKTTVTCALLSALSARGIDVASYKCGPDYIDPMFHRAVLNLPAENLDAFFCEQHQLQAQLATCNRSLRVIEGVMGYYDGIGTEGTASTYEIARMTRTPTILIVNAKGMYTSAGALLQGFARFRADSGIRWVIFNGVSPMLYEGLAKIAREAGVAPLGCLPYDASLAIGSRHLGLVTADEVSDLQTKLRRLGQLAEEHIDLEHILRIAKEAPVLPAEPIKSTRVTERKPRIAVARDAAFCFLYQENLAALSALGTELCFFSPIHDASLPENTQGLYLPGGYPELYEELLSSNASMRASVKKAIAQGLPTIAECGGFLYLHDSLDGLPMVGVIPAEAYQTEKLQRFGYVTLTAKRDNLLCSAGDSIRAHEFHYYESSACGDGFSAQKPTGRSWDCIHATPNLYAGFPHLYFPANIAFAERFMEKASRFSPDLQR